MACGCKKKTTQQVPQQPPVSINLSEVQKQQQQQSQPTTTAPTNQTPTN